MSGKALRYVIAACFLVAVLSAIVAIRIVRNTHDAGSRSTSDVQLSRDMPSSPVIPSDEPQATQAAGREGGELSRILDRGVDSLPVEARSPSTAHDSKLFVDLKAEFWDKATDEQKARGKELVTKLREAMAFPDNVSIRADITTVSGRKRDYTAMISFKFPAYYREDAKGAASYTYITDGAREITDFLAAERNSSPGIVGHDVDADVYFDMFPVRLVTDSELVYTGRETLTSADGQPLDVSILSGWSYDVLLRDSDSLAEELIFYDRKARLQPLIHIRNIQYDVRAVHDAAGGRSVQAALPVRYTVTYSDGTRSDSYQVALSYSFDQRFSDSHFGLQLDR